MPSGDEVAFSRDYIPLLAWERKARRRLIRQWVLTHDPFIAAQLRAQEKREAPFLEALIATVGRNNANWRLVLYWEERKGNSQAKAELRAHLEEADTQESRLFRETSIALARIFRQETRERTKLHAILWTLRHVCKHQSWPTRPMVKAALKKMGCNFPQSEDGKNDWRFFIGPVLGRVLTGKPGAPRGPRRKK